MASVASITGIEAVVRNLLRRKAEIAKGTERGLYIAGLRLQRASQLLVPVEHAVGLKSSAFTMAEGTGLKTAVIVGYTAGYAIYVHENVEMKWKGLPRGGGGRRGNVDADGRLRDKESGRFKAGSDRGNYWDPAGRGQAKFLEEPARTMAPELRKIILAAAKIR